MDDRYLFFALSDGDFFDVPWAGPAEPVLDMSPHLRGFRQVVSGPWVMYVPADVNLPDAGWKIHVSALPDTVCRTAEAVAQICAAEQAAWKMIRSASLVRSAQGKYAPQTISGKVCVVYPCDEDQLVRLASQLAIALNGVVAPRIRGDRNHPTAPIGVRWGAIHEAWIEGADGRTVPGASTDAGTVEDDRSKAPRRPLPRGVAELLATAASPAPLPITNVRVVHRSNAGALYEATLQDGRHVALKEARHHAGLGPEGSDAVARLRHEHTALRRLAGHDISPEPIDYWELEDSDLLVMEWVGADSLSQRVGRTHPRSRPANAEQAEAYWAWAERLSTGLTEVVERMHALGVTHGDLHPGNVVVGPDGPRVVDLEAASIEGDAVTCSLGAPGFHLDEPDPFVRDRFALARTCAYVRDTDVALVDRRPDLAPRLAPDTHPPVTYPAPATVPAMLDQLAEDILGRATPHRGDRLFPGGVEQFTRPLGGHDLLSGAAGTLLALQSHGLPPSEAHLDWLASLPTAARVCHGLAEGAEGVALALALLGRADQAGEVIDRCTTELPRTVGWARGQAGCAVALLELAQLLDRNDLQDRAWRAVDAVIRAVDDAERTLAAPGLLEGWSGVALALLRIRDLSAQDPGRLTTAAARALRREHALLREIQGSLVGCPGGRIRVGLGHGSAAFALGVRALGDHDSGLTTAGRTAARTCREVYAPLAGLLEGLAGAAAVQRTYGDHVSAAHTDERATWHCAPAHRGWSVLGAQRLRCSDDLATGSAGLICALGPDGPARLRQVLRLPVRTGDTARGDPCHPTPLSSDTAAPVAAQL